MIVFFERELVATGSFDRDIRLWKAPDDDQHSHEGVCELILKGHEGPVSALKSLPGGDSLISASMDGTARIWDLEMGSELGLLSGHKAAVSGLEVSRKKDFFCTISFDGTTRIWDSRTYKFRFL